ncbi:CoA transferase [Glaciihabitans sp. UYNi722]|uniref:CoA transferase n=1 Tax=Glaciihabitans sp. UYNi722 TaxID=3156344 RepID=UPI003398FBA6
MDVPLTAALPVGALVSDAVALASLSAASLVGRRLGIDSPAIDDDPVRTATAVTSERHFRIDGEQPQAWAELSGFWRAADGWVRTHANYSHHRERLLDTLGLWHSASADDLRSAIGQWQSDDLEDAVAARGGVLARVRTEQEWRAHPQAVAVAGHPLLGIKQLDTRRNGWGVPPALAAPLAGVRVLDLTRVIAGPVATRTLALWGADVLRVDSPLNPESGWQHLDTGAGKRSTLLDLGRPTDRATFDALLEMADVVVTGYRAGSLDKYGLSPSALAERRPGITVARLSAWGPDGPFADRRGFDSIVQAASGIAMIESADGEKPGALPAQALDHSAGYLLATGIVVALRDDRGGALVETSLARVAQALLDAPRGPKVSHPEWQPTTEVRDGITIARPAPGYVGGPRGWPSGPVSWGSSTPEWLA